MRANIFIVLCLFPNTPLETYFFYKCKTYDMFDTYD